MFKGSEQKPRRHKKFKAIYPGQKTKTQKPHISSEPTNCPFSPATPSPEMRDPKCYLEHGWKSTEKGVWRGRRLRSEKRSWDVQVTLRDKTVSFIIRKRKECC